MLNADQFGQRSRLSFFLCDLCARVPKVRCAFVRFISNKIPSLLQLHKPPMLTLNYGAIYVTGEYFDKILSELSNTAPSAFA